MRNMCVHEGILQKLKLLKNISAWTVALCSCNTSHFAKSKLINSFDKSV